MQRIRHLIALVLLIVFVPATVLAGPLRLCLGKDGHRAVEFALKGAHHEHVAAAETDQASLNLDVFFEAPAEQHQDCTDLSLIAAAVAAANGCSAKPHSVDSGDAPVSLHNVQWLLELRAPPLPIGLVKPAVVHIFGDPQLIALRTVILLI